MAKKIKKEYHWNLDKMPGWFLICLEKAGIPKDFNIEELTEEKLARLEATCYLWQMVQAGLLEVKIVDGDARFYESD